MVFENFEIVLLLLGQFQNFQKCTWAIYLKFISSRHVITSTNQQNCLKEKLDANYDELMEKWGVINGTVEKLNSWLPIELFKFFLHLLFRDLYPLVMSHLQQLACSFQHSDDTLLASILLVVNSAIACQKGEEQYNWSITEGFYPMIRKLLAQIHSSMFAESKVIMLKLV